MPGPPQGFGPCRCWCCCCRLLPRGSRVAVCGGGGCAVRAGLRLGVDQHRRTALPAARARGRAAAPAAAAAAPSPATAARALKQQLPQLASCGCGEARQEAASLCAGAREDGGAPAPGAREPRALASGWKRSPSNPLRHPSNHPTRPHGCGRGWGGHGAGTDADSGHWARPHHTTASPWPGGMGPCAACGGGEASLVAGRRRPN